MSFPSNPKYLGLIRQVVGDAAELFGFAQEEQQGLMLAVNEGCANIIRHCYDMDDRNKIDVAIRVLPDRMEVELRDYGEYFQAGEPEEGEDDELCVGGLGIPLMRKVMDEVTYRPAERKGTLLTMVKYRVARGTG